LTGKRKAVRHYHALLTLAAERADDEVVTAVGVVLRDAGVPWPHNIEATLGHRAASVPILQAFTPELQSCDALIEEASA